MAAVDADVERRTLRVSIGAATALSAVGIVWGIVTGSQMILLDGVYAIIGIVVSTVLLYAAGVAAREPTRRHPYGLEAVTPLAIGLEGLVLLGTLVYAASGAVATISDGGAAVDPGWGAAYGVVATAAGVVVWRWMRRRTGPSDLLATEALTWRISVLTGVGMVVGFALLAILDRWRPDGPGRYVDPAMVLITCVALLPAPLRLLRSTLVELLEGSPGGQLQQSVVDAVSRVFAGVDLDITEVRVAKLGPKLYVDVDAATDPTLTVAEEQALRDALLVQLDELPYDIWLNLELTPRTSDDAERGSATG